jgi:hypothetical protein
MMKDRVVSWLPVFHSMPRRTRIAFAAAGVIVVSVIIVTFATRPEESTPSSTATTVPVQRGPLASSASAAGVLTFEGKLDGSPYVAVNHASGTYTSLPEPGATVACGEVIYRVNDKPALLVCGNTPAYRSLKEGSFGRDVRQLNSTLHQARMDRAAGVNLARAESSFSARTTAALKELQRSRGLSTTGELPLAGVTVLPGAARISKIDGSLGQAARPGSPVVRATTDALIVRVSLEPTQQHGVSVGARAQVQLPNGALATGKIAKIGRVIAEPQDGAATTAATIPVIIAIDDPDETQGLDEAPVQVDIMTKGVDDVLSVPVLALMGRTGGGYAVEVERDGERTFVEVELGITDTSSGRIEVHGDVHAGDRVVVPAP